MTSYFLNDTDFFRLQQNGSSIEAPEKHFFKNCMDGKFFENFRWVFPRSAHHDASIEISFV